MLTMMLMMEDRSQEFSGKSFSSLVVMSSVRHTWPNTYPPPIEFIVTTVSVC